MEDHDSNPNLGMLCSCCDYHSYKLPEGSLVFAPQRQKIEDLCKLCVDNFQQSAVND